MNPFLLPDTKECNDRNETAMSPLLRAAFFEALGLWALFNVWKNLRTGIIDNKRGWVIDRRDNPGGFYLYTLANVLFVCFAFAVLLNALGLIGDPFVWVKQTFAFMHFR